MPLERVAPEEMLRRHREHEKRFGDVGISAPPLHKNLRPLAYLVDPTVFPFRGRGWQVPPITAQDGIRCLRILAELEELTKAANTRSSSSEIVDRYEAFLEGALSLIRRCVIPDRGRIRRLRWRIRLMRNPWRTATDEELGEIIGFFWMCRTKSRDRRSNGKPDLERRTHSTNGSISSMPTNESRKRGASGVMGSRS